MPIIGKMKRAKSKHRKPESPTAARWHATSIELSTDHRVELDAYNIKQFDETAPDMPPGATGAFILRSPVILNGCNAFKSLEAYRKPEGRARRFSGR